MLSGLEGAGLWSGSTGTPSMQSGQSCFWKLLRSQKLCIQRQLYTYWHSVHVSCSSMNHLRHVRNGMHRRRIANAGAYK